jgi:hypothetical protein
MAGATKDTAGAGNRTKYCGGMERTPSSVGGSMPFITNQTITTTATTTDLQTSSNSFARHPINFAVDEMICVGW